MNFVYIVFELDDKMLTLSSMDNLIVPCHLNAFRNVAVRLTGQCFLLPLLSLISLL